MVLKKLWYYSDVFLHVHILLGLILVSLYRKTGFHNAIPVSVKQGEFRQDEHYSMKIQHYCSLYFRIRQRLFFKDNCFFRSALLCRILRNTGFDARLNFGTMKDESPSDKDWHSVGHCWVSFGKETQSTSYTFVFQYPIESTI